MGSSLSLPKNCRSLTKFGVPRSQSGFSMIEVLIAAVIVAAAIVGLFMMYSTGQALVQAQGSNRVTLQLAQQRVEELRAGGFGTASLPDPREETAFVTVLNPVTNANDNPGYERTTLISGVCPNDFSTAWANAGDCTPGQATVQAKRVVVTVRRIDGQTPGTTDPQTQPAIVQLVLVSR
jgi:prepilin-type N-terminal cleavage/methylation domain-containing protein